MRPLGALRRDFLQVLVDGFSLRREHGGLVLSVAFDESTDAIWSGAAKAALRPAPAVHKRWMAGHGRDLSAFLADPSRRRFRAAGGPVRYRHANGGALPLVRQGRRERAVFFLRDIHPAGWNIANGGSDGIDELLHPARIVERELHEELLVVDPARKRRLVLGDVARAIERAAEAWRLWAVRARRSRGGELLALADVDRWPVVALEPQWIAGPDRIEVRQGSRPPVVSEGLFLHVTPEDGGLEVDRIVRVRLPPAAVLLDGEIGGDGQLLDRPVGLFDVPDLLATAARGEATFRPEILFQAGRRLDGVERDRVLRAVLRRGGDASLGLCPVPRCLVERLPSLVRR